MMLNRNIILCILATICHCCHATSDNAISDDSLPHHPHRSLLFFPILPIPRHEPTNHKPFSIFSRPPSQPYKEDNPPNKKPEGGGGFISHVGNVLHGGSIGIEIRPLAPFQGILDHAKKILPGHGVVGRPSHERPDHKPPHPEQPNKDRPNYDRPNKEHPHYERPHQQRPGHEQPHKDRPNYERPNHERPDKDQPSHERPNYERPDKDRPNYEQPNKDQITDHTDEWDQNKPQKKPGPNWEDIGEVPAGEEDDYGEGVLQPRLRRPKRFVESKIYHVPLMYRSNGRTDKVRIKSRNGLRKRSKNV